MGVDLGRVALIFVELLSKIKTRDPKIRARALRGRAKNIREEADRLDTAIRAQELSAQSGSNKKFHERQIRKLTRKQNRLRTRATWWDNRADWIDPQK